MLLSLDEIDPSIYRVSDGKTQHLHFYSRFAHAEIVPGTVLPSVVPDFCFFQHCGFGEISPIWRLWGKLCPLMTQHRTAALGMCWGSIPRGGDFGKSQAGMYGNKPCLPALFPNPGHQNPLIVKPVFRDSAEDCHADNIQTDL